MTAFFISLGVALAVTPFLCRKGNRPPARGGLVLALALLPAVAAAGGLHDFSGWRAYWLGLSLVFFMGVLDDLFSLRPAAKLAFQLAAAALFLSHFPGQAWTPVYFFWLVGITNAFNLMDNMDGLMPGVGALAALGLAAAGFGPAPLLPALAGGLMGFLVFNWPPARIYLGDSGSHLTGFTLAALPLYGIRPEQFWIPLLVLALPILDTTYVTFSRLRRGVSPFQGGKDHLSHRLVEVGLSVRQAVLLLWGITGLLVAATLLLLD